MAVSVSAAAALILPGLRAGDLKFTYSIPGAGSTWTYAGEPTASGYGVLSPAQIDAFVLAIERWDRLIAMDFVRTNDATAPGAIRVAFTDEIPFDDAFAYAYLPQGGAMASDIWINAAFKQTDFAPSSFGFLALLHEIGHALGLIHTHDGPGVPEDLDSVVFSVMSYEDRSFSHWTFSSLGSAGFELVESRLSASGPMVLDIAAIQSLYGADLKTASGDDVYVFDDDSPFLLSIYDAAGTDTIDASGVARASIIDLTPGAYSSIGRFTIDQQLAEAAAVHGDLAAGLLAGKFALGDVYTFTDNLGIALSTLIENAVGGRGNDTLVGNKANNRLQGREGADILNGAEGNDILDGGAGVDVAVYAMASTDAEWSLAPGGGWRVFAGAQGIDLLLDVETLRFTDRDISLTAAATPAPSGVDAEAFRTDCGPSREGEWLQIMEAAPPETAYASVSDWLFP